MTNNINDPFAQNLVGLWDFLDSGKTADTGLADGIAQNGHLHGNANISDGQLHTDGHGDYFDVSGADHPFDLDTGTIAVKFTQDAHVGSSPDVIVNRGESNDIDTEGWFGIEVTEDGKVVVQHSPIGPDGTRIDAFIETPAQFFSPGDTVEVVYSWDAATGSTAKIVNTTTGTTFEESVQIVGLTMDIGDNDDENFTFGAREYDDGCYDRFFDGSIDYVALYDIDTLNHAPQADGIITGDDTGDVIDASFVDEDGEKIDNSDALLPGEAPQDDIVYAFGGDDVVRAGAGNDDIYGGDGNDQLFGEGGDDLIEGGAGSDMIFGGSGDDTLRGGDGDDMIDAGSGDDHVEGGAGNDTVLAGPGNDVVDGGSGHDTIIAGDGADTVYGGSGDDTIVGGAGDDVIYGDSSKPGALGGETVRESFEWDLAPDANLPQSFSQNTGNVNVTFSTLQETGSSNTVLGTDAQNVSGIEDDGAPVDSTSSLDNVLNGQGNQADYRLDFDTAVQNVAFRINDIDGDGVVKVTAFDAAGNAILVQLTGGDTLTLRDTDGVLGAETADSNGGYLPDTAPEYSLLVEIPGPVSRIEIEHDQDGGNTSGINITDIYFDAPTVDGGLPGDDTIEGGDGDDTIFGEAGNDTIDGGAGNDLLYGDSVAGTGGVSGPNLIVNGSFEDVSGLTATGYGFVGTGAIPGWTEAGGAQIDVHNDGRDGQDATDGSNWLDLEASPGNVRVGQDVQGLSDGETYRVSFDVNDGPSRLTSGPGENLVNVYWNGALIDTIDPGNANGDTSWDSVSYDVVAGSGDGSNRLEFEGLGTEDNFGVAIDNVEMYLLAPLSGSEGGDDTITGGDGDDTIFGGAGNDVLTGGAGTDKIFGEDGSDTIFGAAGDRVDGGAGGLDHDILDLTGQGPFYLDNVTPDSNGNGINGTVVFVDASGAPTGETIFFVEIEEIRGNEVGRPPEALDDSATTDEDMPVTIDVLANDSDPDGDPLTVTEATSPDGAVVINPDGTLTFTPDENFNGDTTISYTVTDPDGNEDTGTVTVSVTPVNDAPDAVDDSDTTGEDTAITVDLLANDSDVDGDPLTVTAVSVPADQGSVVNNGDGTATFTPAPNFTGTATISYTISDPDGLTDSAVHTVEVQASNDAPDAENDLAQTDEDTPVTIDVLANDDDPDGDPLTITEASVPPEQGSVEIVGNQLVYTPAPDFNGHAFISYTVSDPDGLTDTAEVCVNVKPVEDLPTAVDDVAQTDEDTPVIIDVLANDTDPDGDVLRVIAASSPDGTVAPNFDGTLTFTPNPDFTGETTITYTITDPAGNEDSATVTVTVNPVNDAPDAVDDVVPGPILSGTPVVIDALANDTDPDGDELTIISATVAPEQGSVQIVGNQVVYTPSPDFEGTAVIDYTIEDEEGLTDSATITVSVSNGIVNGTDAGEVIDLTYMGDPGGDMVDAGDALLPGEAPDDDIIEAGGGDDTVIGGAGDDDVFGGAGDDTIEGNDGDDILFGEGGDDIIDGGAGNDTILGGNGDDTIEGGTGDDVLFGDGGDDTIRGGDGDDSIDGGTGDDVLFGDGGDDTILGGTGDDIIDGGAGNDLIDGGNGGDDVMFGGADRDTFINVNAGDTVDGGSEGDDFDVLDLRGSAPSNGSLTVTRTGPDSNGNGFDGFVTYFDEDGTVTGELTFTEIEEVIPCFTPGTRIATPRGEVRVEDLKVGDLVMTRDNGLQAIRWIGARSLSGAELQAAPHLRPVMIRQGALGQGLPERDMRVSPNHRVLVANEKTALFFGESEVLVAAKHLTGMDGVDLAAVPEVTYLHVMFDQHEVILSDGAWTESFQPGDMTLGSMGDAQRAEILELFPELASAAGVEGYVSARRSLRKHEARLLAR